MPGKTNGTQVPVYAGPAFHRSPSASALPIPKRFLHSSSGSDAQRNAERPGDGDEAVPVTTDKSHEGKGAVSETKEQDRPVDTEPKATFSASPQRSVAFENLIKRTNDEDNGIQKRQPVSEEDEELRRRQQLIIDGFEAQTTTLPSIQTVLSQATIPANVLRLAQALQLNWIDELIRTTGERAAACYAAYNQSSNQVLQLHYRGLRQNLARQQEHWQQQRLDGIDDEFEHGQIPADEEVPRHNHNSNSNRNSNGNSNGNSGAGIDDEPGLVTNTRQTSIQESEGTPVGNGIVPPKDKKEGEEAQEAEYLMEIGAIDDECSCSTM